MEICPTARDFFARQGDLTQQYFVYCKENQRSMAEKDPLFGLVDIFQTGPKELFGAKHTLCLRMNDIRKGGDCQSPPTACRRTPFRSKKLYSAGGARGGRAHLESNRMPRKALLRKARGPRSTRKGYAASVGRRSRRRLRGGDFHTAEQWESNGIFRL